MKKVFSLILPLLLIGLSDPVCTARADENKPKKPRTQGIEKLGEGKYRISETALYRLLGSMAFLSKQARLRPVIRNKVVAGYQIYKIRKGSVFTQLGLKNRDRLERINGVALDGPRRKNQLLARVQKTDKIELILRRKGKRITLIYFLGPERKAPDAKTRKAPPPPLEKKQDHP